MKEFMTLVVKLGPGDLNRQDELRNTGWELEENEELVCRGCLNQESDEWWVQYVFKYSVWKSVAY